MSQKRRGPKRTRTLAGMSRIVCPHFLISKVFCSSTRGNCPRFRSYRSLRLPPSTHADSAQISSQVFQKPFRRHKFAHNVERAITRAQARVRYTGVARARKRQSLGGTFAQAAGAVAQGAGALRARVAATKLALAAPASCPPQRRRRHQSCGRRSQRIRWAERWHAVFHWRRAPVWQQASPVFACKGKTRRRTARSQKMSQKRCLLTPVLRLFDSEP
jgi:hypothetical protein